VERKSGKEVKAPNFFHLFLLPLGERGN